MRNSPAPISNDLNLQNFGIETETQDKDIFDAISQNNLEDLESILSVNEDEIERILGRNHFIFGQPIFYAIIMGNLEAIDFIIDKKPSVFQSDFNNLNPFEYAILSYVTNFNSTNPDEAKIAKSLKILNSIYKKQFKAQHDLSEEQLKFLMDYDIDKPNIKIHFKMGYNKNDEDCPMIKGSNIMLYKNLLQGIENGQENQDQSQSNPFLSSALKTLDSVNNFDKPIEVGDEKLYIFNAQLIGHCTYFIFHVNDNKLTHISYCDGNRISTENSLSQDSKYLKGGVRKFNIKTPIDFSEECVGNFLKENSTNVEAEVFYNNFRKQGLKIPRSSSAETEFLTKNSESAQFLIYSEFLIPTKEQTKGNCTFKSLTILWRYLFQIQNPTPPLKIVSET
jgi:hypothetical protein